MIKLLIFDMDDTLYDEKTYVMSGFRVVSKHLSKKFNINEELLFEELINSFEKQGRGRNFNFVLEKFKLKNINISDLVYVYRNHFPKIKLLPGVENLLNQLSKNFKLGIITDGNIVMQKNKVKSLKLAKMVDFIIYTDEKEFKEKPNLSSFKKALTLVNCEPNEVIYVGDDPNRDFIGAKELGIKTVRIRFGKFRDVNVDEDFDADFTINNIYDLHPLLKKLSKEK